MFNAFIGKLADISALYTEWKDNQKNDFVVPGFWFIVSVASTIGFINLSSLLSDPNVPLVTWGTILSILMVIVSAAVAVVSALIMGVAVHDEVVKETKRRKRVAAHDAWVASRPEPEISEWESNRMQEHS